MDDESIELGIAEAIGKATAAICIETSIVRTLLRKGVLSPEEVATLGAEAEMVLKGLVGLSEESTELGLSALRGCTQAWTKVVTKN